MNSISSGWSNFIFEDLLGKQSHSILGLYNRWDATPSSVERSLTHRSPRICSTMMFRAVTFLTFALSALAVPQAPYVDQCNPGSVLCCDSVYSPSSVYATSLVKALQIDNVPQDKQIATGCGGGGINVGGGSTCNSNPVCCERDGLGGLIGIGCAAIPVSI
ncbi:hypothetical protein AcW1_002977 [Taiwanofungus camphoratus]|nr:hypothetical protein AcV5_001836 [Antrodia cinnamomea]KAI0942318.1 hypothetical protein AcW1_002977 [Antrodia cinnamomea]